MSESAVTMCYRVQLRDGAVVQVYIPATVRPSEVDRIVAFLQALPVPREIA